MDSNTLREAYSLLYPKNRVDKRNTKIKPRLQSNMQIFLTLLIFSLLMIFMSNALILNDEMLIILQVQSVGSGFEIHPEKLISYQGTPWVNYGGKIYAPFSYFVPFLAFPIYSLLIFLKNHIFPDILFFLVPCFILLYLSLEYRKYRFLTSLFLLANLLTFKPIYRFEDWGCLYSIQLVNIILTSLAAVIFYKILRQRVSSETALISVMLFIFATPVAYWTLTAKSHSLSLFLILMSIYSLHKHLEKVGLNLFYASVFAGLAVFARPLDGFAISASLIVFLFISRSDFKRNLTLTLLGLTLGYLPCALFGLMLFGLPLPVEIVGNMFSGVNYVKTASHLDILLSIPLIFFGLNNQTLGILNYSPVLAILLLPLSKSFRKTSVHNLTDLEKFLVVFTVVLFVIYLPFLKSGVVDTGVRDYRFYLPLFIPLIYFLSRKIAGINYNRFWQNFALVLLLYVLTTATLISVFVDFFSYLTYIYLFLSIILLPTLTFFDRLNENTRADVLSLTILPLIFLISDRVLGYFGPYDIHFCLPLLNRFIEFLILFKGLS